MKKKAVRFLGRSPGAVDRDRLCTDDSGRDRTAFPPDDHRCDPTVRNGGGQYCAGLLSADPNAGPGCEAAENVSF